MTPLWTDYFTQFVVAVIATISFGITFHVPKRHYLAGGLTGAALRRRRGGAGE